jgi:hypothetical protein
MKPGLLSDFFSSTSFKDLHSLVTDLAASAKKSKQQQSRERAALALLLGQISLEYQLRDDEWEPVIEQLPDYPDLLKHKVRSQLLNVGRMLICFRPSSMDAEKELGWTQLRTISEMSDGVQEIIFEKFMLTPNLIADMRKVDLEDFGKQISLDEEIPYRRKQHLKPDKYSRKQLRAVEAISMAERCFQHVADAVAPFKNKWVDELEDGIWDEFAFRMISAEYQWRACGKWFASQIKRREGYRDKR